MSNWNDSLLIGVELIDDEHRKLIMFIDKLIDSMRQGKSKEEISQILNNSTNYAKEHLRDEENLLERCAYPGINAHKRQHAQFTMQVGELVKEFKNTGSNVALIAKMNKTLAEWLVGHISTEDKKIGEFINKQR